MIKAKVQLNFINEIELVVDSTTNLEKVRDFFVMARPITKVISYKEICTNMSKEDMVDFLNLLSEINSMSGLSEVEVSDISETECTFNVLLSKLPSCYIMNSLGIINKINTEEAEEVQYKHLRMLIKEECDYLESQILADY